MRDMAVTITVWTLAVLLLAGAPACGGGGGGGGQEDVGVAEAGTHDSYVPGKDAGLPPAEEPLDQRYARTLTGVFDSSAQADKEPDLPARRLITCPVSAPRIGAWVLYGEEALTSAVDSPTAQWVHVAKAVGDGEGLLVRRFTLLNPDTWRGACALPAAKTLRSEMILERKGCELHLAWTGKAFAGGTRGTLCGGVHPAVSYLTLELTLDDAALSLWERGMDAHGVSVQGDPTPTRYDRISPLFP